MICAVGDWVAFHQNSRIVIGRVLYRDQADRWPNRWQLHTDVGFTEEEQVLERRFVADPETPEPR